MKNKAIAVALTVAVAISFYSGFMFGKRTVANALKEPASAKVVRVVDGDTIEIEGGERVRYLGVGSPESVDPQRHVECFGEEAKQKNKMLVEGKTVRLEYGARERDRFCRLLAYVWVGNALVNTELIREGYAKKYLLPRGSPYTKDFIDAENEARTKQKGLWSSCPVEKETVRGKRGMGK